MGVPLAARERAAVQRLDGGQETVDELRRRDRPRSDAGRHADVRAVGHQGQHDPLWPRARRHRARQPGVAGAEARIRAMRAVPGRGRRQTSSNPGRSSTTRPSTSSRTARWTTRIQKGHSIDNTFSWFIPEAKGRHDLKFGARYSRIWLSNPALGQPAGHVSVPGHWRHRVQRQQPQIVSRSGSRSASQAHSTTK